MIDISAYLTDAQVHAIAFFTLAPLAILVGYLAGRMHGRLVMDRALMRFAFRLLDDPEFRAEFLALSRGDR